MSQVSGPSVLTKISLVKSRSDFQPLFYFIFFHCSTSLGWNVSPRHFSNKPLRESIFTKTKYLYFLRIKSRCSTIKKMYFIPSVTKGQSRLNNISHCILTLSGKPCPWCLESQSLYHCSDLENAISSSTLLSASEISLTVAASTRYVHSRFCDTHTHTLTSFYEFQVGNHWIL